MPKPRPFLVFEHSDDVEMKEGHGEMLEPLFELEGGEMR